MPEATATKLTATLQHNVNALSMHRSTELEAAFNETMKKSLAIANYAICIALNELNKKAHENAD